MKTKQKNEEMIYTYKVHYSENNETEIDEIECSNPGTAFALCLKAHPEAQLLRAIVEGTNQGYAYMEHLPPPVQRQPEVKHPRRKKEVMGCEFPFYDEVKSRPRPNLT